jgi:hypothetical protein
MDRMREQRGKGEWEGMEERGEEGCTFKLGFKKGISGGQSPQRSTKSFPTND